MKIEQKSTLNFHHSIDLIKIENLVSIPLT